MPVEFIDITAHELHAVICDVDPLMCKTTIIITCNNTKGTL